MAIPDYQSIMLPLLKYAGDQKEHSLREAIEALAKEFQLTADERKELLPSGRQARFDNRVGWARTYMSKAGLLDTTRRGHFKITSRGKDILAANLSDINVAFLEQFQEFKQFKATTKNSVEVEQQTSITPEQTPEEQIEAAYQGLREQLAADLLDRISECAPAFFEKLVVDLLVKMGYGGTRRDAGRAIGSTNDEGIDGIINEDRLGLDIVYIQAKRWAAPVHRPELQKFAGALQGQRARKGIFITTSSFSPGAREYVSKIESKIVLIDGSMLAQLMIDFGVGVNSVSSYEVKRVDSDYFNEQ